MKYNALQYNQTFVFTMIAKLSFFKDYNMFTIKVFASIFRKIILMKTLLPTTA